MLSEKLQAEFRQAVSINTEFKLRECSLPHLTL